MDNREISENQSNATDAVGELVDALHEKNSIFDAIECAAINIDDTTRPGEVDDSDASTAVEELRAIIEDMLGDVRAIRELAKDAQT